LYGKTSIDMDVWPRTLAQAAYLNEELIPGLKEAGAEIKHWLIHIEPIDKASAQLIGQNRDLAEKVYEKVGAMLEAIAGNPVAHGMKDEDFDILKALGIAEDQYEQSIGRIMSEGSERMRSTAVGLKRALRTGLSADFGGGLSEKIVDGLANSTKITLARVANRVRTQARRDDASLFKLLRRLGAYYRDTATVALRAGSHLVYAGGTFEREDEVDVKYAEAIGGAIESIALLVNRDYDLANEVYEKFKRFATELYLVRTSK
ncbi:hypothetical protein ACFL59_12520, partial [Planctomycetota bacterium]